DCGSRLKSAFALCFADHADGCPVLDASTRVQVFKFGVNVSSIRRGKTPHMQHRSLANKLCDIFRDSQMKRLGCAHVPSFYLVKSAARKVLLRMSTLTNKS